jgi:hypothetical protein
MVRKGSRVQISKAAPFFYVRVCGMLDFLRVL